MKQIIQFCLIVALGLIVFTCKRDGISAKQVEGLPAVSGDKINIVVEIPAGTNHKIEYRPDLGTFVNDTLRGKIRVIDFLPYPGNYGFVPGTLMDPKRGGDGDPLDVLLLCESLPTGTVVTSLPLGTLLLRDRGDIDTKIIAIPADPEKRIIKAENFVDFLLYYDPVKRIIEQWFANYKGPEKVEVIRWEDDVYAWREINRWMEEE